MVQFQVGPVKEKHGNGVWFDGIGGERAEKKTGWKILPQETSENILTLCKPGFFADKLYVDKMMWNHIS